MDQHDKEGKTQGYGMTIPHLIYNGAADLHLKKHDAVQGTVNEHNSIPS